MQLGSICFGEILQNYFNRAKFFQASLRGDLYGEKWRDCCSLETETCFVFHHLQIYTLIEIMLFVKIHLLAKSPTARAAWRVNWSLEY